MLFKVFEHKGEDLARMRNDAGMEQTELAFLLYKDPKKRQRISKIERNVVQPTLAEAMQWYYHCVRGVEREEVLNAIKTLEKASVGKQ